MVDYREILRLRSLGDSIRNIARSVCSGRDTVSEVLKAAKAAGIVWPLEDDITNEDIQAILFPGKYAYSSPYTVPDYLRLEFGGVMLVCHGILSFVLIIPCSPLFLQPWSDPMGPL